MRRLRNGATIEMRGKPMKRRNLKAIAITLLATAMLFTACGAAGPVYTRATMTVHYVR
jgi:hypothetical protein